MTALAVRKETGIIYRFANAGDLDAVASINVACFGAHKHPLEIGGQVALAREWVKTFLLVNGAHKAIVAECDGEVVGYVVWQATDGFRAGTEERPILIQLFQIGVSPSYQSEGVGQLLVDASLRTLIWQWLQQFVPQATVAHVYVVFAADNEKVFSFYERNFPIAKNNVPFERMPGRPEFTRAGWLIKGQDKLVATL